MEYGYRGFEWIFADFKTDCFVFPPRKDSE